MKLPRYFFAFFFVSGFCSLVYEVVWLRLSMARFGVTTPMVSIVLSVFMAGLGLASPGIPAARMRCAAPARRLRARTPPPLRVPRAAHRRLRVRLLLRHARLGTTRLLRDTGALAIAWGSSLYYLASRAPGCHHRPAALVHVHGRHLPLRDGRHPPHDRRRRGTFLQLFVSRECAGRDRRHARPRLHPDRTLRILRRPCASPAP